MKNTRRYLIAGMLAALAPSLGVGAMEESPEKRVRLSAPSPGRDGFLPPRTSVAEIAEDIRELEGKTASLKERFLSAPAAERSSLQEEIQRRLPELQRERRALSLKLQLFLENTPGSAGVQENTIRALQQKLQALQAQAVEYAPTVLAQWEKERTAKADRRRAGQHAPLGMLSSLQAELKPYERTERPGVPALSSQRQFKGLLLREAQDALYRGLATFESTIMELGSGESPVLTSAEKALFKERLQHLAAFALLPLADSPHPEAIPQFMQNVAQTKRIFWENVFYFLYHCERDAVSSFMATYFQPYDHTRKIFLPKPEHAARFFALWEKHAAENPPRLFQDGKSEHLLRAEYTQAKSSWLQRSDALAKHGAAKLHTLLFMNNMLSELHAKSESRSGVEAMVRQLGLWNASPFLAPELKSELLVLWDRPPGRKGFSFETLAKRMRAIRQHFTAAGLPVADRGLESENAAAGEPMQIVPDSGNEPMEVEERREQEDRERQQERRRAEEQQLARSEEAHPNELPGASHRGGGE